MIVVSDTSPLNYLVLINAVDLLPSLFGAVYVPPKVIEELTRSRTPDVVKQWVQSLPPWLKVSAPKVPMQFTIALDPGEAHAIALAKELHAAAILIDDKRGRRVAEQEGLDAIGTITVLELAARKDLIALQPALEALQRTSFRIPAALVQAALAADAAPQTNRQTAHQITPIK